MAVSDPGVVFDETRPNVNYWEPWYLGLDPNEKRPKHRSSWAHGTKIRNHNRHGRTQLHANPRFSGQSVRQSGQNGSWEEACGEPQGSLRVASR